MADRDTIRFQFLGTASSTSVSKAHGPASRSGPVETHAALAGVTTRRHFDLSAARRASGRQTQTEPLAPDDVLALELEGGFVFYTSAGRLADDLRRQDPEAERDGVIQLQALRRDVPTTRSLGDWAVQALSVLGVDEKCLIGKAAEKLQALGGDALAQGASWAGTKAIMWAIEEQLARQPGLYAWSEDETAGSDLLAQEHVCFNKVAAAQEPILLFIHGTGSSTRGSFGELHRPEAAREWRALRQKFGQHIYGFEHRTFSCSPIENALDLARALPAGARLSLVTHSRGGLVGDLLAADGFADLIADSFRRTDARLAAANQADRDALTALATELAAKRFVVERYVRVAAPAQGTLLASSHIDAFLSVLLHVIGLVPGLAGTPYYAVVQRVLLQIVKNRTDPRLVPGIEAMLPDAPLAALIGRARPQEQTRIAVVAGDIEGNGVLKRLGVFLTDSLFFEAENNDLVVDTASMFGGIARDIGRYVFDQGADVSHFRYFANARTRRALQEWLTGEDFDTVQGFQPIRGNEPLAVLQRGPGDVTGARPVVFVLPGIMGSHLQSKGDRIWFDFLDLARGNLMKLSYDRPNITPDGLFQMFYGDLCQHFAATHDVMPFAYDWRQPLTDTAALLDQAVNEALTKTANTGQPVRLIAHSMGGLVARAMMAARPETWQRLVDRPGSRLLMLGTPNRGSHGTVESLLGLSGTMRKLALLHPPTGLQAVLDLLAAFPGAIQLLPRPGFRDTGEVRHDYYTEDFWADYKQGNDSLWFGNNLGAVPTATLLQRVKQTWENLNEELPDPQCIAYVAGYGHETPCGIERADNRGRRLRMVGTLHGDGTVTHASGILDVLTRRQRVWYMPADHSGLTTTAEYFPALSELLERGETTQLVQTRPVVRGGEQLFRYEPGPVLYPTPQDLERALIGGRRPLRRRARARQTLSVCCKAMDLRHALHPILVGHYEGDAISGAEAQIDKYVVDNRLTLRHHVDAYAGPLTSVAVVLDEPNAAQAQRGVRRGAVVLGLGSFGDLTLANLAVAVRQGVMRYLLQLHDRSIARTPLGGVGLSSVLLGYNSTTHITIEDSVSTVMQAVMEANRQFADAAGASLYIERLEFVELFEDVAISAAKAIRDGVQRLQPDAERLGFRLEAAQVLDCGEGMRARLEVTTASFDYWPRLIVTVADDASATHEPALTEPQQPRLAHALRYVYLSRRARAEAVEQQRQPGLIEDLLDKSVRLPQYQPNLARALFHLLVPHDFKVTARQTDSLVLVLDGYTANLPWEMLVADDEPLIKKTAMVRQLTSGRFRQAVRSALDKRAYVIGNPSTAGYFKTFPRASAVPAPEAEATQSAEVWDGLADLPGAALEARAVADLLSAVGYQVTEAPPGSEGIDVVNRLYEKPYRILHVSAHGVYRAGQGTQRRTGVVLSNGLLLTATEIAALEVVPDLVFLNCCFTGRVDATPPTPYNRLAYSIARELIESGVRAVIAAGWAVDDAAARHFAERFYQSFLRDQRPFGLAVQEARLATYEQFSHSNTWGAFQAYGEPSFVMEPENRQRDGSSENFRPVAPQELVARLDLLRQELAHSRVRGRRGDPQLSRTLDRLLRKGVAAAWAEQPAVLYALGRLHAEAGDFAQARRSYEQAIALEDQDGRVPVVALERLAALEAHQGAASHDTALIYIAIERLLGLTRAVSRTGSADAKTRNAARCGLLGDAYKWLASLLTTWSGRGTAEHPTGIREALEHSAQWYQRGEGELQHPDFSPTNCQNRVALQAVLGTATLADAQRAMQAGEIAAQRYAQSYDPTDLLCQADGRLIAYLLNASLQPPNAAEADAVEYELVASYRSLSEQLSDTAGALDTVLSQLSILAGFYKAQGSDRAAMAHRLHRLQAQLSGTTVDMVQAPQETVAQPAETAEKRPRGRRAPKRVTP